MPINALQLTSWVLALVNAVTNDSLTGTPLNPAQGQVYCLSRKSGRATCRHGGV